MRIGALNRRIALLDEHGAVVASPWAEVTPLGMTEAPSAEGAALTWAEDIQLRMRYRDGVTPRQRLRYRGRLYHVTSVVEDTTGRDRRREMTLIATHEHG
ncbi:MAG: phage head closure protein [Geminicoccaceae bacterium]